MQMEVAEWRPIDSSRSMRIIRREFQQGTPRLNIRQKFTTGRTASRVERLPGEARKWPPVEAFGVKTRHLLNYEWNYSCHSWEEQEKCAITEVYLDLNENENKEVKLLLCNILNPLVYVRVLPIGQNSWHLNPSYAHYNGLAYAATGKKSTQWWLLSEERKARCLEGGSQ